MKLFKKCVGFIFILVTAVMSLWYISGGKEAFSSVKRLPVIMYHSVSESEEGRYVIPKYKLEEDFKYLSEKGYEAVTARDLAEALKENKPLPKKPVIITFDDGYYNNFKYALPLIEKYKLKAVISVIGKCIERYDETEDRAVSYACLNSEDINSLISTGRIEIANHSYDMHRQGVRKGTMRIKGEDSEKYKEAFCTDARSCYDCVYQNTGVKMKSYTYPYGQITGESVEYLDEMGYDVYFTCYEKINVLDSISFPMGLGRFNRDGRMTTSAFMEKAGI